MFGVFLSAWDYLNFLHNPNTLTTVTTRRRRRWRRSTSWRTRRRRWTVARKKKSNARKMRNQFRRKNNRQQANRRPFVAGNGLMNKFIRLSICGNLPWTRRRSPLRRSTITLRWHWRRSSLWRTLSDSSRWRRHTSIGWWAWRSSVARWWSWRLTWWSAENFKKVNEFGERTTR